jgi:hypothetical protein
VLTPRNFIGLTIAIAVFSMASLCWSMLQPPDGGGMRADSYGTRGIGYRALFELLGELDVPVRRQLGPPKPSELADSLLVMWDPRVQLIDADPKWLRDVESWLRQGGQAVVAFDAEPPVSVFSVMQRQREAERRKDGDADNEESSELPKPTLFELLGIGKLDITNVDQTKAEEDSPAAIRSRKRNELPSEDELADTIREVLTASSRLEQPQRHSIKATGVFAGLIPDGSQIELPTGLLYEIDVKDRSLHDTIHVVDESGAEHCVAARIPVGKGHVNIVSIRRLISNANIGSADNIVVAAALLMDGGRGIVFDEFYHGATIRGNPMWLFSTVTYGSVAVALLMLLAFAVWRAAVFLGPPVAETPVRRRSIREYLDAMSRFLREAKGHGEWSLEQVREGVLWKLRREFGLPPESHDQARLTSVMARKDPRRADRLIDVLNEVDAVLNMPRSSGERRIAQLVQRMTECLSKTAITRSEPKSLK